LGGAPLDGERHIWWNFVSSSKDRIEQAKEDWKEGRFPKVPGDEAEFIPLPEVPRAQRLGSNHAGLWARRRIETGRFFITVPHYYHRSESFIIRAISAIPSISRGSSSNLTARNSSG
jgi:hypothetical protein